MKTFWVLCRAVWQLKKDRHCIALCVEGLVRVELRDRDRKNDEYRETHRHDRNCEPVLDYLQRQYLKLGLFQEQEQSHLAGPGDSLVFASRKNDTILIEKD